MVAAAAVVVVVVVVAAAMALMAWVALRDSAYAMCERFGI